MLHSLQRSAVQSVKKARSVSSEFRMASTSTYWTALTDDDLTVNEVEKNLAPIQDDLWVAAACVDRVVDDSEVQRTLLKLGLARTNSAMERSKDALAFSTSPTASSQREVNAQYIEANRDRDALVAHFRSTPADAHLCSMRAVLLERLDRLNTYVDLCKEVTLHPQDEVEDEIEEWEDDPWADGDSSGPPIIHEAKLSGLPPIPLHTFLTDNLLNASCQLASLQHFGALHIILKRHGPSLWAYRLTILKSVPEHVHPSNYRNILPTFDISTDSEPRPTFLTWRPEQDWSETPEVQAALKAIELTPSPTAHASIILTEHQPHHNLMMANELSSWYTMRVHVIMATTGFIDIALATVQYGASQGIPGLDELGEELSLLSRLVYDAPQGPDIDADWTLSRWNSMEPPAVVRAYLTYSTPDSLPKDVARLVMPYLYVLESRAERAGSADPHLPTRLLYDYILSAPLDMAAAIFEASKPTLPAAQRLIRDDQDLARLALACLYGSDRLDQWSTMSRIFECLPAWDISRSEDGDKEAADSTIISLGAFVAPSTTRPRCSASDLLLFFKPLAPVPLSRALDILDVHLESGEILSRWGVPAPMQWFLQSNADIHQQRAWANRMARRAGGSDDQLDTQEDWEWLLEDMLKLTDKSDNGLKGAFGLLSRDEILRIFFSGLLSSGKTNIAESLLRSSRSKLSLGHIEIENICLDCSREFYDNATSGNYKFGDMKLAYDCLNVARPSARLIQEKEFIEATSRISSFNVTSRSGIPLSPLEIRLTKDRLSLVSQVLSSNDDAYKHTEVILDLVQKLGFRDDVAAEVKTLAMLADTALQVEDFPRAYELSERMVDSVINLRSSTVLDLEDPKIAEASEACWVACFQLGRQSEFDDLDKKLTLLGRALEICPPEKLHDILMAWRRLETEDIDSRKEQFLYHPSGVVASGSFKRIGVIPNNVTSSLRARLQDFHMPSPPLLSTPDAAALASRTFKSVAANFPFSVGHRDSSQASDRDERGSRGGRLGDDVSTQATRVFSKGIGWLIGADEEA